MTERERRDHDMKNVALLLVCIYSILTSFIVFDRMKQADAASVPVPTKSCQLSACGDLYKNEDHTYKLIPASDPESAVMEAMVGRHVRVQLAFPGE
jgi:hypothetical protein